MGLSIAANSAREVVLVHSSDLHVDEDHLGAPHGGDGTRGLRSVLAKARALRADVVLLAGDTFENNQLSTGFSAAPASCSPRRRCRSSSCPATTIRRHRIRYSFATGSDASPM